MKRLDYERGRDIIAEIYRNPVITPFHAGILETGSLSRLTVEATSSAATPRPHWGNDLTCPDGVAGVKYERHD